MAQNETWLNHDLMQSVKVQYLDGNLFSQDNAGNLIGVNLTRIGVDYSGGGSVSANVIRADGVTVAVSGALSGNKATVVLPQAAYAVPGVISIVIKLTISSAIITIGAIVANVYQSSTDAVVDPGTIIPSVQNLIDSIDTAVASIPADYSALWAKLAPPFDSSKSYKQGEYVTYNGGLYRFKENHTGSWSSDDVFAVTVGGDLKKDTRISLQNREKLSRLSANLFNKDDADIQTTRYMGGGGWVDSESDNRLGSTHPIAVKKGVTYRCKRYQAIYGDSNSLWVVYVNYPGDMAIRSGSQGTTDSNDNDYMTWTATDDGFVVKSINIQEKAEFMFCESELYPSYYEGYGDLNFPLLGFNNAAFANGRIVNVMDYSPNLFDVDSNELNTSRYASTGGWVSSGNNVRLGATHPIYVEKNVTYKWKSQQRTYGSNAGYMFRYRYSDDLIYGFFTATIGDDGFVTCTPSSSGYVVIDVDLNEKGTFMVCEESVYPDSYRAFGKMYFNDNFKDVGIDDVLFDKVVVCDGDSIAAAITDSPLGLGGWFGRLQTNHSVTGANYAVGGGTITNGVSSPRHYISTDIDTIHETYSDLDYLILEGGTNDADLIGRFVDDTPPSGFGTWSADDFSGNYNNETFCGAVEYLFYKALLYYPHAKIGFIIAMQMGTNTATVNNRKRYFDEIVKIAKKWHIPVLNLWENAGADARINSFYDSEMTNAENVEAEHFYYDGQHPTSYGYNKLQNMIEEWMRGL